MMPSRTGQARRWTVFAILLILSGLGGSPAPTIAGAAPAWRAVSIDEAELARRNGDFDGAGAILRSVAAQADPYTAGEALLQLGVVMAEANRGDEAAGAARELLAAPPDPVQRARATFVLGRAQRAAGDCAAALRSFAEARRLGADAGWDLVAPYIDLQMSECHARLGDRTGQAARAAAALAGGPARQGRIDALEHVVDAALKRGDRAEALRASEPLLAEAGLRPYRARTLASIGTIQMEAGRRDEAARAFATIVGELTETAEAETALDGLIRLDALGWVAADQIGLVHHFQNRHARAVDRLTAALDGGLSGERAARARYYLGASLLRSERLDDGVAALRRVASDVPGSEHAPQALLRAARALETSDRLGDAAELYREAIGAYPGTWAAQEARYRLTVTLLRRGALPDAIASGQELGAGGTDSRWKGLGLFWAGKGLALAGDRAQAEATWRQAADLDLADFGGLRAQAILDGEARPANTPRILDPAALRPTQVDLAEMDAWLAARGADPASLEAEQAADLGYVRARELFRLGLREPARWELQDVAGRQAGDPARLYGLARFAADHGEPQLGIRFGVAARQAAGQPFAAAPRVLQRLIMPLPYAELIVPHAEDRGVDPLLFAALIRQESTFFAGARSSANAVGLAQVVPATGQGIARALGRDLRADDLSRPIVSVELGVYYLASQLTAFNGLIYPALAAYNAGGGPVQTWLREYGGDDSDLFAERIPYAETNHYVQVVYENYRLYQRLYGG